MGVNSEDPKIVLKHYLEKLTNLKETYNPHQICHTAVQLREYIPKLDLTPRHKGLFTNDVQYLITVADNVETSQVLNKSSEISHEDKDYLEKALTEVLFQIDAVIHFPSDIKLKPIPLKKDNWFLKIFRKNNKNINNIDTTKNNLVVTKNNSTDESMNVTNPSLLIQKIHDLITRIKKLDVNNDVNSGNHELLQIESELKGLIRGGFANSVDRLTIYDDSRKNALKSIDKRPSFQIDPRKIKRQDFVLHAQWVERRLEELLTELEITTGNLPTNLILFEYIEYPKTLDSFYELLIKQINNCYRYEMYAVSYVLIRKLFENLIIDILRKKFPNEPNLYLTNHGRYLSFYRIVDTAKQKISNGDFANVKNELEEAIDNVMKLREEGNKSSHSITFEIIKSDMDNMKKTIQRTVHLLTRALSLI